MELQEDTIDEREVVRLLLELIRGTRSARILMTGVHKVSLFDAIVCT